MISHTLGVLFADGGNAAYVDLIGKIAELVADKKGIVPVIAVC